MRQKHGKKSGKGKRTKTGQPVIQKKKSVFDGFSESVSHWKEKQEKRQRLAKALHAAYQALENGKVAETRGCDYAIEALRQKETVTPLVKSKVTAYLDKKVEFQIKELVKRALTVQFKEDEPLSCLDEAAAKLGYLLKQRFDDSQFPTVCGGRASFKKFVDDQLNKIKSRKHALQEIRLSQKAVALFDSLIESPTVLFSSQEGNGLSQWVEQVSGFVTSEKQSSDHTPVVTFLTRVNMIEKRNDLLKSMRLWCKEKIENIVEQAMDRIGKCVNGESKVSTLPQQLNDSIKAIDEIYGRLLNYAGLIAENAFSQRFNEQVQKRKKTLQEWIDFALEAGQTYNAKTEHLRLIKTKEKSITPLPEVLRGLRYVGEPSSSCGVSSARFFVCMGTLLFAGGLGWATASLMSLFNSTLPLFFGSITFDAISPVASSLIIVVTCIAFIALVLGARHLDYHQKATHFYNQFNLFHENQKSTELETAYNDYLREKQSKDSVKAVTVM